MIAKNVGIRRARGRFVLATNVDVLLSDELVSTLAEQSLSEHRLYRCDRYDVTADIPAKAPIDEQLHLCAERVIRINRSNATIDVHTGDVYPIYPRKLPSSFPLALVIAIRILDFAWEKVEADVLGDRECDPQRVVRSVRLAASLTAGDFRAVARLRVDPRERWSPRAIASRIARWRNRPQPEAPPRSLLVRAGERWRRFVASCRAAVEWEQARVMLHTNACGDFTLLSQQGWSAVSRVPELKLFSMHLDSLLLYPAHYAGFARAMPRRPRLPSSIRRASDRTPRRSRS